LMADAGLIVLCSFISPFRAERQLARNLLDPGEFIEVFVDTPLEVAEYRDRKGLYQSARQGLTKNFTGIDSPYERPEKPEVHLVANDASPEELAAQVVDYLIMHQYAWDGAQFAGSGI
ncbi:adenylyl-sulfate kinase, partial [Consotaella aegiceratis]|uniref:adenylyl-sulfate kinase n=1 Tax=Consotaella aegiceratis TaxID=3097961 RepID=UPI002F402BE7